MQFLFLKPLSIMFTKLNSAYTKFKNNITKAIEPGKLQVNHVLVIAFAVIALVGLIMLIVAVLTWPVATFGTIILAALLRVFYAGFTGR